METEPTPAVPDYLSDPDATLKDAHASWRYGKAPDYSNTRKVWAESTYRLWAMLQLSVCVDKTRSDITLQQRV